MAEDTRRYVDVGQGKDVTDTIYSTTGQPRSKQDFQAAFDTYESTGKAPPGFVVLQPGVMSSLRSTFEDVNDLAQKAAPAVGSVVAKNVMPTGFAALAEHLGILKPGTADVYNTQVGKEGEQVGSAVGSMVNTPGKAGLAAGLAAASPLIGPTTALGVGGAQVLSKVGLLRNMGIAGLAGSGGAALGREATGEGFDWGKTATEFGLSALSGGFQGVLQHWMSKYLSPDKQEVVAKGIIDTIAEKYPNLKSDPNVLRAYASNGDNVARVTAQMSKALRGTLDDTTNTLVSDINTALPRNLTVGQQNTLRAQVRRLQEAGNDFLDNITDKKAMSEAEQRFFDAHDAIVDTIKTSFPTVKNIGPTVVRVSNILTDQKNKLGDFAEGGEVLGLLRQSSQEKGFNPEAFAQVIKGVYQRNPGSLLEHVGDILGQGQPLTSGMTAASQPPTLTGEVLKMLKQHTPILKYMPSVSEPKLPPMLSWRAPEQMPAGIAGGFQAGGAAALQDFYGNRK